jgi:hypothetical protein
LLFRHLSRDSPPPPPGQQWTPRPLR